MAGMAREASPSTPRRYKSQSAMLRATSTDKLEAPHKGRGVGAGGTEPGGLSAQHLTSATQNNSAHVPNATGLASDSVVSHAVGQLWSACAGDEKYWAQIQYAHSLLTKSIGTELAMSEAVSRTEEVLEPIFKDVILAQQEERLNAATMLAVLRELVVLSDGEGAAATREAISSTNAASSSVAPFACERCDDDEETQDERESQDELLSDSSAIAALSVAAPPTSPPPSVAPPSSPEHCSIQSAPPCTPQRPRHSSSRQNFELTPEAVTKKAASSTLSPDMKPSPKRDDHGEDLEACSRKRIRSLSGHTLPKFPLEY
eukprot:TRINITY_DN64447_c0_g1_i1.p1 TRINITY_DN64447_c0_g1~~TRINITY_DN64447_c0_g1_i1.p1  ORF type:complete len:316 (-),score=54.56 TRINITY_DN64447_c0_g1_i1:43-990(-)